LTFHTILLLDAGHDIAAVITIKVEEKPGRTYKVLPM
jgi:hypothetical protein